MSATDNADNAEYEYSKREIRSSEDISLHVFDATDSTQPRSENDSKTDEEEGNIAAEEQYSYTKSFGDPDIAAQIGMWKAANALVWLTFFQIIIGFLTVGLVLATFWTQKGELEVARNSSRGVIIATKTAHVRRTTLGRIDHEIRFDIQNIGNGIATSRRLTVGAKDAAGPDDLTIDSDNGVTEVVTNIDVFPGVGRAYKRSFNLEYPQAPISIAPDRFFAWCIIEYTDGFGCRWRSTCTFHSTETMNAGELSFSKRDFIDVKVRG